MIVECVHPTQSLSNGNFNNSMLNLQAAIFDQYFPSLDIDIFPKATESNNNGKSYKSNCFRECTSEAETYKQYAKA